MVCVFRNIFHQNGRCSLLDAFSDSLLLKIQYIKLEENFLYSYKYCLFICFIFNQTYKKT